jgi:hypothetical protein
MPSIVAETPPRRERSARQRSQVLLRVLLLAGKLFIFIWSVPFVKSIKSEKVKSAINALAFACLVIKRQNASPLAATLKDLRFVGSHSADGAREKLKNLLPVAGGFQFSHCASERFDR